MFCVDQKRELLNCTTIKAATMLLIVLYHSTVFWTGSWFSTPAVECVELAVFARWLNTIHVPVFVFVSGYLYAYLKFETDRYKYTKIVIAKKARRLLVPYVFVCAVWAVPFYVAYFGTADLFERFVLGGAPSQLWFLLMLFGVFCIAEIVFRTNMMRKHMEWCLVLTSIFLYFGSYVLGKLLPLNCFQIVAAMQYAPLFFFGMLVREKPELPLRRVPCAVFLILNIGLFVVDNAVGSKLLSIPLWILTRLSGTLFVFLAMNQLLSFVEKKRQRRLSLGILEEHSFSIFLFHQQIIWTALAFLDSPSMPPLVLVCICFIVSLAASILISVVLKKWKVTRQLIGG